jgi:hypothetical protein
MVRKLKFHTNRKRLEKTLIIHYYSFTKIKQRIISKERKKKKQRIIIACMTCQQTFSLVSTIIALNLLSSIILKVGHETLLAILKP